MSAERAAEERAARRAARERGEHYEPPPCEPEPDSEPEEFQAARAAHRRRRAPADEPRRPRAADRKAGAAPVLPPQLAQAAPLVPAARRLARSRSSARRSTCIDATFQPLQDEHEQAGASRAEAARTPAASGSCLRARRHRRRVLSSSTATLTRAAASCAADDVAPRHDQRRRDQRAIQGRRVGVVKTFDMTIPEGPVAPRVRATIDRSGIEGCYLRASARRPRSGGSVGWARRAAPHRPRAALSGHVRPAAGATTRHLVDRRLDASADDFAAEPDEGPVGALRRGDHRLADRARDAVTGSAR